MGNKGAGQGQTRFRRRSGSNQVPGVFRQAAQPPSGWSGSASSAFEGWRQIHSPSRRSGSAGTPFRPGRCDPVGLRVSSRRARRRRPRPDQHRTPGRRRFGRTWPRETWRPRAALRGAWRSATRRAAGWNRSLAENDGCCPRPAGRAPLPSPGPTPACRLQLSAHGPRTVTTSEVGWVQPTVKPRCLVGCTHPTEGLARAATNPGP